MEVLTNPWPADLRLLPREVRAGAEGGGGVLPKLTCGTARSPSSAWKKPNALKPRAPRDERGREGLQLDVVVTHVAVVEAARELDLVLGGGQLLLEIGEGGDGLEVGVVLGYREQAAQALAQHVLGLADLGGVAGGAGRDCGCPRVGDRFEGAALVPDVALDRLDQVRDQVVAALELDVDLRPGFLGAISERDEAVVGEDEPKDDEDDDSKDDPPAHQEAILRVAYAWARRAQRVFFSIFLCLCLRIFLRRFLITEPNPTPRRA